MTLKSIKIKLHRFLFPREDEALRTALEISYVCWTKSPSYEKRAVGEDIHSKMMKILK